jgi:hypothetical protein
MPSAWQPFIGQFWKARNKTCFEQNISNIQHKFFSNKFGGGSPPTISLIERALRQGHYNEVTRIILTSRGEQHEVGKVEKEKLQERLHSDNF